ncbi:hypothetical protein DPM13_15765 [Paracoccus mutanolyticus]|uniref:Uncharacterized protein n=1 Tax=Paracoccus mutanolyticus TaxID=1499308 RepID=A0ABM6WTP1_9RHOB|nr:hypothetical protein [Paracoccus mutanolyticus]AWX93939.1 hypothetical protein DPM13_15765 [Paracoccus mutanolyticus]
MNLPIITADQRLAEPRGIKGCIFAVRPSIPARWTIDPGPDAHRSMAAIWPSTACRGAPRRSG